MAGLLFLVVPGGPELPRMSAPGVSSGLMESRNSPERLFFSFHEHGELI